MQPARNRYLILNWIFIIGLLVLAVNDHYFKWQAANWLSGKASDFAGLLIFPMFLQFLFPRFRWTAAVTALIFVLWKLPVSTPLITFINQHTIIHLSRTVDYADFIALLILPLSAWFMSRIERYRLNARPTVALTWIVAIPASFVFMATTAPVSHYLKPGGDIYIGKSYKLKLNEEQALAKIKSLGFAVDADTSGQQDSRAHYYQIKNAVLGNGKDTIEAIHFGFLRQGGTLLLINHIQLKDRSKLVDSKALNRYKKYYQQLIASGIVDEVDLLK